MSGSRKYFPQLDGMRGYALIIVCTAHWNWQEDWLHYFRIGPMALEMFFVLSGFLITRILLKGKEAIDRGESSLKNRLKIFYIRRVLRIFPAFYAVLLITYIFNEGTVREAFWWNFFYATNFYLMKVGEWAGTITHFWSLAVEEHFYLIWPIIILLVPKKHLMKVMGLIVLSAFLLRVIMAWYGASFVTLHVFSPLAFDGFGLGGILAYMALYQSDRLTAILDMRKSVFILFLLILFLSLSRYISVEFDFAYLVLPRTLTCILFFWIVGKAYLGFTGVTGSLLENKWMVWIGQVSYAAYLYHNFVPGFYLGLEWPGGGVLRWLLFLLTTLFVAKLSAVLIEGPFNRVKQRFKY